MKKVEYLGEDARTFAHSGVTVTQGDVIEVEDDFAEFNFSDTDKPVSIAVIVPPIEIPAVTVNEPIVDENAGATDEVASTDKALVENDAERGE
jgi:hypothetical protein